MILALLEREIWRLSGSDWQLKLLASTVTSQLPVNCKRIRVSEWFSISRFRVSGCEISLPIGIGEREREEDAVFLGAIIR